MGLFNFKKSIEESGILQGLTDWHSHILPGVDDGIKTMEDSIETLRRLEETGITELWLTPHIMEDIPNSTNDLKKRFEELKRRYTGAVTLHLASENMLDPLFESRLSKGDLLPLGVDGDRLLVETSYFSAPINMYDLLDKIKISGLNPVLAHPERYIYMNERDYRKLKEMGVEFQVNFISFAGGYGKEARDKADWLLEQGFLDYSGSDLHSLRSHNHFITRNALSGKTIRRFIEVFHRQNSDL